MQMKCLIPVLAVTTSILSAASAKNRADLNINEIVSTNANSDMYRVIKGYNEIYPFLVIEKIQLPLTEGDSAVLSNSWEMNDFFGAKTVIPLKERDNILDMRWRKKNWNSSSIKMACQENAK